MSLQVERILGEIAPLSPDERRELALALPAILSAMVDQGRSDQREMEQAATDRERFHARSRDEGRSFEAVSDNHEMLREERLNELRAVLVVARRDDE